MISKKFAGMVPLLVLILLAVIPVKSDVLWSANFETTDLSDWDLSAYYTDSGGIWHSMEPDFKVTDGMLLAPESDDNNITHFAFHDTTTESGRWTFNWVPDSNSDTDDVLAFIVHDTITNYDYDGIRPDSRRFEGYGIQLEVFNSEGRIPDTRIQLLKYQGNDADVLNSILITRVLGNMIQGEHNFVVERTIAGKITLYMDNTYLFQVEDDNFPPAVRLFWQSSLGSSALADITVEENIFGSTITQTSFIWLSILPSFMVLVIFVKKRSP